jgi:hypothetical protein
VPGADTYQIKKKELHITNQQEPYANEMNEHYCRRWISVKTIVESLKQNKSHFLDAQISHMKTAVMSFGFFHQQPKTLSKGIV